MWLLTLLMVAEQGPDSSTFWSTEWQFTPLEKFPHRAGLITPCRRQQLIMKKSTEVLLHLRSTKTSTWTTASVLLATKLNSRNTSKVCVKYVQKKQIEPHWVHLQLKELPGGHSQGRTFQRWENIRLKLRWFVHWTCSQWFVESDTFRFRITIKDKPLPRGGILSILSPIYDPLGFAAPFTLKAKKLPQDIC